MKKIPKLNIVYQLDIIMKIISTKLLIYIYIYIYIYTVKPLYKKPLYKKKFFIRTFFTHLVGIQPFPH